VWARTAPLAGSARAAPVSGPYSVKLSCLGCPWLPAAGACPLAAVSELAGAAGVTASIPGSRASGALWGRVAPRSPLARTPPRCEVTGDRPGVWGGGAVGTLDGWACSMAQGVDEGLWCRLGQQRRPAPFEGAAPTGWGSRLVAAPSARHSARGAPQQGRGRTAGGEGPADFLTPMLSPGHVCGWLTAGHQGPVCRRHFVSRQVGGRSGAAYDGAVLLSCAA